jgi:hypothetical protein
MDSKICVKCGLEKPLSNYRFVRIKKDGSKQLRSNCNACHTKYSRDWCHKTGKKRPLNEAKDCGPYLGIVVAERALSKFFDHIERMPYSNPGYDFICGKGFKIDVKSACLCHNPEKWGFHINKNQEADYFLCIAFDNRVDLTPLHVWLIPGNKINHLVGIGIYDSRRSFEKWSTYEQPIDKVIACCSEMRGAKA